MIKTRTLKICWVCLQCKKIQQNLMRSNFAIFGTCLLKVYKLFSATAKLRATESSYLKSQVGKMCACMYNCYKFIHDFFIWIFCCCRGEEATPVRHENYLFYTNQIPSRPDGDVIDNIHQYWFGDMNRLERHHGYIQWLFPIMEQGVNSHSSPLTNEEKNMMIAITVVRDRMLKSLRLMMDFYGMVIKNDWQVERATHWKTAYANLIRHPHNNLRITRILKCLTIFNLNKHCAMFLKFLVKEVYVTKELNACKDSLERYWLPACDIFVQREIRNHIKEANQARIVDL